MKTGNLILKDEHRTYDRGVSPMKTGNLRVDLRAENWRAEELAFEWVFCALLFGTNTNRANENGRHGPRQTARQLPTRGGRAFASNCPALGLAAERCSPERNQLLPELTSSKGRVLWNISSSSALNLLSRLKSAV